MAGLGARIIIETPDHDRHLADQPVIHLARILQIYRDRMRVRMSDSRRHALSQSANAGATRPIRMHK
jgi:galactose-1-phosphate uridylyltransferase